MTAGFTERNERCRFGSLIQQVVTVRSWAGKSYSGGSVSWQRLSLQLEGFRDETTNLPVGRENEGSFGSPHGLCKGLIFIFRWSIHSEMKPWTAF